LLWTYSHIGRGTSLYRSPRSAAANLSKERTVNSSDEEKQPKQIAPRGSIRSSDILSSHKEVKYLKHVGLENTFTLMDSQTRANVDDA